MPVLFPAWCWGCTSHRHTVKRAYRGFRTKRSLTCCIVGKQAVYGGVVDREADPMRRNEGWLREHNSRRDEYTSYLGLVFRCALTSGFTKSIGTKL